MSPAPATLIPRDEDASVLVRNTDCALNVLCVLGFISSGDGGTEAERTLGSLGLPNSTTMQSQSFNNIEREISPVIVGQTEEIIVENPHKDVEAVFDGAVDPNTNTKLCDLWLQQKLPA